MKKTSTIKFLKPPTRYDKYVLDLIEESGIKNIINNRFPYGKNEISNIFNIEFTRYIGLEYLNYIKSKGDRINKENIEKNNDWMIHKLIELSREDSIIAYGNSIFGMIFILLEEWAMNNKFYKNKKRKRKNDIDDDDISLDLDMPIMLQNNKRLSLFVILFKIVLENGLIYGIIDKIVRKHVRRDEYDIITAKIFKLFIDFFTFLNKKYNNELIEYYSVDTITINEEIIDSLGENDAILDIFRYEKEFFEKYENV